MNQNGNVPLSVVIIAKDEERNLPECLESVRWAAETVVVVDPKSTDRTAEIAKNYTDKVIFRTMDVEGRHRNFAYGQATQNWVLSLDADERVSPELAAEIKDKISQSDPAVVGYSIPIKTYIGKRWIKGAGYYPASKLRLHKKGTFRYEETGVHPRAFLDGKEKPLTSDIIHYGYRDMVHFLAKLNNQTTLEAEKWLDDGRKMSLPRLLYKATDRFWRHYIGKKGYADGFLGFFMSICHSLYQLFTYAKYWEAKQNKDSSSQSKSHLH